MTAANQGDIEVTLADDDCVLRCTLGAAKEINARFGSFTQAAQRVDAFDLGAYVAIVASGLRKTPKEVEGIVFNTGMATLQKPVGEYLGSLSRGGKPDVKDDESEDSPKGE